MKHLFLIFISAVFFACGGKDQKCEVTSETNGKDLMEDSTSYTSIQWVDSTFKDLGKVAMGQSVEVSWKFKNTGNKPLVIADVKAGCGCTVADRPNAPIAPDEEGVIKATFNSKGQSPGEHHKNVTVQANTKDNTQHFLTFRAEVTNN